MQALGESHPYWGQNMSNQKTDDSRIQTLEKTTTNILFLMFILRGFLEKNSFKHTSPLKIPEPKWGPLLSLEKKGLVLEGIFQSQKIAFFQVAGLRKARQTEDLDKPKSCCRWWRLKRYLDVPFEVDVNG